MTPDKKSQQPFTILGLPLQVSVYTAVRSTRKCLDGSVPPYLNNYFYLNTSVDTFITRHCNDTRFSKVNVEVAKGSFCFTGMMEFNSLPCHI